mmetsp:Transcript_25777/g.84840  ORF Transcript_25777/g.84840 Transcript_25777/m.84840 type:complete len:233 (+) Transcript_25777:606-1304(+)
MEENISWGNISSSFDLMCVYGSVWVEAFFSLSLDFNADVLRRCWCRGRGVVRRVRFGCSIRWRERAPVRAGEVGGDVEEPPRGLLVARRRARVLHRVLARRALHRLLRHVHAAHALVLARFGERHHPLRGLLRRDGVVERGEERVRVGEAEVARELSVDETGVAGVDAQGSARRTQAPVELEGEEDLRELALTVRRPPVEGVSPETFALQIGKVDGSKLVSDGGDIDNAARA